MTGERLGAQRMIEADPAAIFQVRCDPRRTRDMGFPGPRDGPEAYNASRDARDRPKVWSDSLTLPAPAMAQAD